MTVHALKSYQKEKISKRLRPSMVVLALLCIFLFLLLIKNPEIATQNMSRGLSLCANAVIPSLFPFMVLSELIIKSGGISRLFSGSGRSILPGVSARCVPALIISLLSGAPVGAKSAASLYRQGDISSDEYSRLLAFCNIPSPPFLIGTVGTVMFGDRRFGITLYAISIVSALLGGTVGCLAAKKKDILAEDIPAEGQKFEGIKEERSVVSVFTSSVTSAALSVINVSAFVVFFCTFVGAVQAAISRFSLPPLVFPLLFGFFEMTSGVAASSAAGAFGEYLAAFAVGWSGLSVHLQVMSICDSDKVSFRPYILSKAAASLINILLLAIIRVL